MELFIGATSEPRLGDVLADFLLAHGVPVADLSRPPSVAAHRPGDVCGAAVLLSAAAAAALAGVRAAPGPVPGVPDVVAIVYEHGPARPDWSARSAPSSPPAGFRLGAWSPSWSPARHAEAVAQVRAAIGRGDVYQVNVVGHASAPFVGDPRRGLARLGRLPGARYGGVIGGAGWAVGCASPETLVRVDRGVAVTQPIKGTRPASPAGRAELLASGKERAEHIMIVDLARNDLARVARTGTVRVEELYGIRRWAGLWQAESTVAARLEPGVGLPAVLAALCPGGSVTGAPKLAALEVIAALEATGRGPSMGALGWVTAGRIDLGLTIRTVAADADRLHVWAGGGITWGSEPAAEVAEAAAKMAPLVAALGG